MNSSTLVRHLSPGSDLLLERVGQYFERHPEVSRENFLHTALNREMLHREREPSLTNPATKEEIRQHAWLEERLENLCRPSFWTRVRSSLGF